MPQLSPELLRNLRSTLTDLPFFESDQALRAKLVDERVKLWQVGLDNANNVDQRVDLAIEHFVSKYNVQNENGLVLLLEVLADAINKEDASHRALLQLCSDVQKDLQSSSKQSSKDVVKHDDVSKKTKSSVHAVLPVPPPPPIDFVNRDEELRKIRAEVNLLKKCWVIDGLGGYGKTTFLSRIHEVYAKDGWLCVYVALDKNKPIFIEDVAEHIGECISYKIINHRDTIQSLGAQLANGLLQHPIKPKGSKQSLQKCTRKGIALLIDNLETLTPKVFADLADLMIAIDDGLYSANFYEGNHHKLRIFLAGRDIRRRSSVFSSRDFYYYEGISLRPYTFHSIQETVQKYALLCNPNFNNSTVSQISARLMYLNGGHPGLTAHILSQLKDSNFTNTQVWLGYSPEEEFQDHIGYMKDAVLAGFGNDIANLLPIVNILSVYRRFGTWLLRELIQRNILDWNGTEFELETKLTNAYVLRREQGILKDSITQRLLSIKLRFEDEEKFEEFCKLGIELYKNRICLPKTIHPHYWAVEHVYFSVLNGYYAEKMRGEPLRRLILDTIKEDRCTLAGIWDIGLAQDFTDLLIDDWELEFFVNFFLSDQRYQADHYQKIIQDSL